MPLIVSSVINVNNINTRTIFHIISAVLGYEKFNECFWGKDV